MKSSDVVLEEVKRKFGDFRALLDRNNRVLRAVSELEEKSHSKELFEVTYITERLTTIHRGVKDIIDLMLKIGGDKYSSLYGVLDQLTESLDNFLPGNRPVEKDDYTLSFDELGREKMWSVGSKNAQLGEMKSRLGLPVPEGFAISAWAYRHFVNSNSLQEKITDLLDSVHIDSHEDLVRVGHRIRSMIRSSDVPAEIAEAIDANRMIIKANASVDRFSMRSSAIGEDTVFSFAGQYASVLNVPGDSLVSRYKDILAGKFTPKAIYYLLSHSLSETDLAMSVGCVAMIDAAASGVAYSRDPIHADEECVLVNSVFGLGSFLVDGKITPDTFRLSRSDGSIQEMQIADKPIRMVLTEGGGTESEPVPEHLRKTASITSEHLKELTDIAIKLEEHYGSPQDIEWALDKNGKLLILQTRPLHVLHAEVTTEDDDIELPEACFCGGTTVYPGAGAGKVFKISSPSELPRVPDSVVLVARHPFPGLITVMEKISALVTEVGGVVSHMAALAREYGVPTLVGVPCRDDLIDGAIVTVDATGGAIYRGEQHELISRRTLHNEHMKDLMIFKLLEEVLSKVSPLNLINPADPGFRPENCQSFHDITRFAHQKAVEEMFASAEEIAGKRQFGIKLKSDIPLEMRLIFIDDTYELFRKKKSIKDDEIVSAPMESFWNGIKKEGWPKAAPPSMGRVLETIKNADGRKNKAEFSESSFAILSHEYMIAGLHMGYHFTTIEAICTNQISKNFIRMQYKEGGAVLERRIRRVKLISEILSKAGFGSDSRGDFFTATVTYIRREDILDRLYLLGRLTMMTKQLDMALHNDDIAEWYTQDLMKRLGLS